MSNTGSGILSETMLSGSYAGTYYYLIDGARDVAAVANGSGRVSDSYAYDPLGGSSVTGSQQVANPFTFQGGMFDSQTGYYYIGSHSYDPATGQSFGCTDKGSVDPGEDCGCPNDSCGEDGDAQCGGDCSALPGPGVISSRPTLGIEPNWTGTFAERWVALQHGFSKAVSQVRIVVKGVARRADFLDESRKLLVEIKNVKELYYSSQLRDFAEYAAQRGFKFILYVRRSTVLSTTLKDAETAGEIVIEFLELGAAGGRGIEQE